MGGARELHIPQRLACQQICSTSIADVVILIEEVGSLFC